MAQCAVRRTPLQLRLWFYIGQGLPVRYKLIINANGRINFFDSRPSFFTFSLQGQVGGSWALEIKSFWALWNGIEQIGECHLGPKNLVFFGPCPSNGCCPHQKHYAQGCINHRCIGGFMYKSPQGRFQCPYCGGWGSRCTKELNRPAWATQVHKGTSTPLDCSMFNLMKHT
jgi:hypothetical protein